MNNNVVDSSAWLEYFTNGSNAGRFEKVILDFKRLIVPSICILEVFKKVLKERGEDEAFATAALMQQGRIVSLDLTLSLLSAQISLQYQLPLADSVVYATALQGSARLWTQDADFKGLPEVKYFAKTKK